MLVLSAFCDKSYIVQILLIVKTIFTIACYLVPTIIIIVTIINLFKAITSGKDEDLKDNFKIGVRRIIAGLVVVLIPTILSYVFNNFANGEKMDFLTCLNTATQERVDALKAKEQAEEEAKQRQQEAEDERELRAAYEADQKNRDKNKQTFEEWKKEHESSNNSTSSNNSGLTGNAWTNKLLSEAKSVTDYARNNNFAYGDAPINPAMDHSAKLVSCDRCVAWFLYNMGYTNQPQSHGVVVSQFPAWCEQNGFRKITNINELKAGDVVFVNPDANGSPKHVFLLGNPVGNGIWERYDCGSVERIRLTGQYSGYQSQPFKEGIGGFMYAYRAKEAE